MSIPVSFLNALSVALLPSSRSRYNGQFATSTTPVFGGSGEGEADAFLEGLMAVPLTPQAARKAESPTTPAPAPAYRSSSRRDNLRWLRPRSKAASHIERSEGLVTVPPPPRRAALTVARRTCAGVARAAGPAARAPGSTPTPGSVRRR